MYITTLGDGEIYVVALDAEMNPIGAPRLFATIPGSFFHDGVEVDICGNLYVAYFGSLSLYRISPDGIVKKYIQWDFDQYGHGIEWGNGIGGWDNQALYLPQPYDNNTVVEVKLGVPSRKFT